MTSSVRNFANQVFHTTGKAALERKDPDDVVVTTALRTPLCKARKGGFKDVQSDELLFELFKTIQSRIGIQPGQIDDICVGTVLTPGATYQARVAALAAGIPQETPLQTINRFCSSGLMAVQSIANEIRNDEIEIGLAVGFESMSANPDSGPSNISPEITANQVANDALQPMGWTSENVATDFNLTREQIDSYAFLSHNRAEKAQREGVFDSEIMPIEALTADPNDPKKREKVLVTRDDGIRPGTTKESLARIRAAFGQWGNGVTTGGNASQITDGAGCVLLMKRKKAESLGLEILAKHVATSVVGLSPRIMGIGPAFAIPKVLERCGITKDDVDVFEINEAFATMYAYCVEKLGLDPEKVNVHGGAIALGHPLGATGARQVATGLNAIKHRGGKILVTSMCIGTGQGAAAVWVNEQ